MQTSQDLNDPFRIASFRHVVDLFDSKCLHLSRPSDWDDPYEQLVEYSRQENVFAQCWSKRASSDAMWRIYSPDRMGLCIRTTRGRLVQALENANATVRLQYSVMQVEYFPDAAAVERASALVHDAVAANQTARGAMAALFVKRAAFDHEAEVRAVVHIIEESPYGPAGHVLHLPIDPHELVDQIVFDPRADPIFVRICTHYLRTRAAFTGQITRSMLYEKSQYTIAV